MGQAHHLSAAVLVLKSCSKQASLLRCLVKIESAFEINNIPRGRLTRVAERIFSWAGLHIFGRDSVAQITLEEVRGDSPMLSGRTAAESDERLDAVVNQPWEKCRAAAGRSISVSPGWERGEFT